MPSSECNTMNKITLPTKPVTFERYIQAVSISAGSKPMSKKAIKSVLKKGYAKQ